MIWGHFLWQKISRTWITKPSTRETELRHAMDNTWARSIITTIVNHLLVKVSTCWQNSVSLCPALASWELTSSGRVTITEPSCPLSWVRTPPGNFSSIQGPSPLKVFGHVPISIITMPIARAHTCQDQRGFRQEMMSFIVFLIIGRCYLILRLCPKNRANKRILMRWNSPWTKTLPISMLLIKIPNSIPSSHQWCLALIRRWVDPQQIAMNKHLMIIRITAKREHEARPRSRNTG